MYYIILVLMSVLLGLNCSQLYVYLCSPMEGRGERAAAFIPLYKTSASDIGLEQDTDSLTSCPLFEGVLLQQQDELGLPYVQP